MLSKFAKITNKETRLKPVGDSCYGPKIYNLKTNPTKPTPKGSKMISKWSEMITKWFQMITN